METSLGRRTTCNQAQPNSERFVINAIRYLWDVYDSRNEGQDLYSGNVNYLSETLFRYEEGYANHEEGEPWSCGICPVGGCGPCPLNDRDGRSAVDFKWNHKERWGFDSVGAYLQNCEPVGD